MSEHQGPITPDLPQTIAFHEALIQRLGLTTTGPTDQKRVEAILNRLVSMIEGRQGDIFFVSAYLLFEIIRGQPFGKGSTQTGIALAFAFLYRNGIMIVPPQEEEITGLGFAIADGAVYVAEVESWLRQCARRAW